MTMTIQDRKRRIAWYTRLMVIAVPLVLVLVAFLRHFASRPLFLDLLVGPSPGARVFVATGMDGTGHSMRPLHRRQNGVTTMSLPVAIPSTLSSVSGLVFPTIASTPTPTSTQGPSQVVPTIPSSAPDLPTPFPQAFDTTLGSNFTTLTCEAFFTNMTQSLPFRQCRPFSLLSQTSSAFLQVSWLSEPCRLHVDLYIDVVLQFTFRHSQISRYSTLIFGVPVTLPSAPICVHPTWIGSSRRCWTHVLKKRVTTINW